MAVCLWALLLPGFGTAAELGDPAPALTVAQWIKGPPVDLQTGRGQHVYVVVFWTTSSPACLASFPHLNEMQNRFKDRGVVFVGVCDEAARKVQRFTGHLGSQINYPVAVDAEHRTTSAYLRAFGVRSLPHAFVVDKSGRLAWRGDPMFGLDGVIEEILAEKFDLEAARKIDRIRALEQKYFLAIAADQAGPETAALGQQILTEAAPFAGLLNEFAWRILTDRRFRSRQRDRGLALRAAQRAHELTRGTNAAIVDTYARALFDTGNMEAAIQHQKQAVALATEEGFRFELEATLNRYLRKAKEAGRHP